MAQGPADNLIDVAKNTFVKPVQNVLSTIDKYTPSWLPGVNKPATPDPNATKPTAKSLGWADQTPTSTDATKPAPKPVAKKSAPKYHQGTDYVPKTGPAVLKKGEAVLNNDDADTLRAAKGKGMKNQDAMKSVADELGGKSEKPAKEIKHIVSRKAKTKDGKHVVVHTHVHTHPAHPDEEHVTSGDDEMAEHMMQNMGTPNPGEAEADAGQGAAPAGAAPVPGAAAPGAGPAPAPAGM